MIMFRVRASIMGGVFFNLGLPSRETTHLYRDTKTTLDH